MMDLVIDRNTYCVMSRAVYDSVLREADDAAHFVMLSLEKAVHDMLGDIVRHEVEGVVKGRSDAHE